MKPSRYIWKNGKFLKWEEATVHMLTHTFHYSSGVFEGIRFYETEKGPAIFRLKEHVDRLFYSAKALHMKMPYTKKQVKEAIIKTVKKNKLKSGYIRPIAYFGYGMGLSPKKIPVEMAIAAWTWDAYLGEDPAVKVKISPIMRIHPATTVHDAKICGHYSNSIMASIDAQNDGFHEALLLDQDGLVAEGPGENIFIVKRKKIYTPQKGNILPGITRDSLITLAQDLGYKIVEKKIKPKELKKAHEVFFSGTAAEVTPIAQIDDTKIKKAPGPITMRLKEEFMHAAQGKNRKYKKWITLVK